MSPKSSESQSAMRKPPMSNMSLNDMNSYRSRHQSKTGRTELEYQRLCRRVLDLKKRFAFAQVAGDDELEIKCKKDITYFEAQKRIFLRDYKAKQRNVDQ